MLKKRSCIYVLLMLYLFNSSCVALLVGAGAGTAGVIWYKGKLQETVSAPAPRVHQAIKSGLRDLHIKITEDKFDNLTAEVEGVLADDRKVSIDAVSIDSSTTKLTIRVGVFGDKDLSQSISDAIKKYL
jgi:hypothetical protein